MEFTNDEAFGEELQRIEYLTAYIEETKEWRHKGITTKEFNNME